MDPLPALVRALNEFRPAVVESYPTVLAVLAGEQADGRLRIAPALLLSGAERLSPPLGKRISESFQCPLRDTYAASEFMGIAFDCRYGRLHVNADWLILEPVDAAGKPVAPGEASHTTLLTNLANRVQPLIRYDLGDSVTVLPAPCPCGSPLPAIRPEGRRDETLWIELADGVIRPLIPLVLATAVEEAPGVLRYQVLQAGPRRLRLRLEEAPGHDRARVCDDVLRRLRAYLSSQGLAPVEWMYRGTAAQRHGGWKDAPVLRRTRRITIPAPEDFVRSRRCGPTPGKWYPESGPVWQCRPRTGHKAFSTGGELSTGGIP